MTLTNKRSGLILKWTICVLLSGGIVKSQQPEFCTLPNVVGPCRAAFPRYYFNSATQQCERFVYGGCQGNANNFETLVQCQSACRCTLPLNRGTWIEGFRFCTGAMTRYFDMNTGKCKTFFHWGCGGNANRFASNEECDKACAVSQCYAPRQTGRCGSKSQTLFFYNVESSQCESFNYNGCNAKNENRFFSEEACKSLCASNNA